MKKKCQELLCTRFALFALALAFAFALLLALALLIAFAVPRISLTLVGRLRDSRLSVVLSLPLLVGASPVGSLAARPVLVAVVAPTVKNSVLLTSPAGLAPGPWSRG